MWNIKHIQNQFSGEIVQLIMIHIIIYVNKLDSISNLNSFLIIISIIEDFLKGLKITTFIWKFPMKFCTYKIET